MADDDDESVVPVGWSPIWVTLIVSFAQGIIFFFFFLNRRKAEKKAGRVDIYEKRSLTRSHRSPPAWGEASSSSAANDKDVGASKAYGLGMFGWARAVWSMSNEETLRCVGLDSYMYLRFLRLGFRCTLLGSILGGCILIPLYGTGGAEGADTEQFNAATMANIEAGSHRLWVPAGCWIIFVAFVLREMWTEWQHYAVRRSDFLAKGDVDTAPDFRYAVLVENVPKNLRSNASLRSFFERLFPGKVRQVSVCMDTSKLDKLVAERMKHILGYEKAVAFTHAKPQKPAPKTKINAKAGCCCGEKVEAIPYHEQEIARLNEEIDAEREALYNKADATGDLEIKATMDTSSTESSSTTEASSDAPRVSSSAFVTFTSLRAKQSAVQCELSGKIDHMDPFPAPEPTGVLWENLPVARTQQQHTQKLVAVFWTVGVMFWAVPVSFVTSIANLNGILTSFGLDPMDETSFLYGLIAGLLPVIFLAILMAVLYMAIGMSAAKVIRKKSMPEVDSYTFYWHQLYQFANLWLILIGGSAMNQLDGIINDPASIVDILASAMPGASTFFINMIIVGSLAKFGMELSNLVPYVVRALMNKFVPEVGRTQRTLDAGAKPTSIQWGKQLPPMIFIFLVSLVYMTMTPIVEVFAAVFFGGHFLVWKHQCLHVYSQEFEGGGKPVWENLSSFMFISLYMSEAIFFAYMGIKEGPGPAVVGIIALVATILVKRRLTRNVIRPLQNLALEVAAHVDIDEGELENDGADDNVSFRQAVESQLYGHPNLKKSMEEREPLPYRRDATDVEVAVEVAESDEKTYTL